MTNFGFLSNIVDIDVKKIKEQESLIEQQDNEIMALQAKNCRDVGSAHFLQGVTSGTAQVQAC